MSNQKSNVEKIETREKAYKMSREAVDRTHPLVDENVRDIAARALAIRIERGHGELADHEIKVQIADAKLRWQTELDERAKREKQLANTRWP